MTNVVDINTNKPHIAGEAICTGCKHSWFVVSLENTTELECPNCGTMKGRLKFNFVLEKGTRYIECGCGNDLFMITEDGKFCPNCGKMSTVLSAG